MNLPEPCPIPERERLAARIDRARRVGEKQLLVHWAQYNAFENYAGLNGFTYKPGKSGYVTVSVTKAQHWLTRIEQFVATRVADRMI